MARRLRKMSRMMVLGTLLCSVMISCEKENTDFSVKVMERPVTTEVSVNYTGNRAPLKPLNFIKLPVGDIQPKGWLKKYLLLQKEGLTGRLGEISAWLEKENNAWLMSGGNHGWEEVPYWLKGYGNLAYILKDSAMIAETRVWIEAAIASQREDGYFGPVNERNGRKELWANMVMLWCMQSYYEYSQDSRVLDLMTAYFKWQLTVPDKDFLKDYWENSRGGDNLYSVYWLYNITGDKYLLDLAEKIHRNTADWTNEAHLPNWHNVNIAQCFREPATYYMLSGDSADLQASYNVHNLVRRIYGQVPGGMFGADENARLAYIDPRQGTETCGFVEQMASDELLLRMTGDPFWAEHCEEVAFNSYPAAVMPDFRSLRYITCPNHVVSDSKDHKPGIDNGGPFLAMNPFSSRCCQHNHAQGWPYYIENLVLASADNGLAAIIYGACTATAKVGTNSVLVTLTEETNYPFEEEIRFKFDMNGKAEFPFYLRIPSWCPNARIAINGNEVTSELIAGQYVQIHREWKNGDIVTLQMPMSLNVKRWQTNKNSASINYGPLTYSLLIKENYQKVNSEENAIWDSKWQKGADVNAWPTYEIYPDSPWNYALKLDDAAPEENLIVEKREWPSDDFPFTIQNVPFLIKAKGRKVPSWKIDKYGLCGMLPEENCSKSDTLEDITLIPMGAARLRISSFPVAQD